MGRRLGQHFLHSRTVLDALARHAQIVPGEPLLEVGPGAGALTARLLEAGARVTAVEVDPLLAQALRERWEGHPHLRVVQADILKADLSPQALFGAEAPYGVVANLPYYLSTPLLFRFVRSRRWYRRLLLMVQQEVGERLVALPEQGKVYGALSIAAHHAFEMRLVMSVPPGAFRPPPKVHSAVVSFVPRPARLEPELEARYLEHVKRLFTARRKHMIGTLRRERPPWPPEALARVSPELGDRRAEALHPDEHLRIFQMLACP
jgi:16S rRNA (adenine1518-N6/adenine1519-N6)-dimethyltransferase